MTPSRLIDILFIGACTIVVLPLIEFGYSHIISQYSILFLLAAYFTGKYVRGIELKKSGKTDLE